MILLWNNLDIKIRKANSLMSFKNSPLKVGRPTAMPTYGIYNPIGLKFLTTLNLGLIHLNEHKFKHNFKQCENPLCTCSLQIESPSHFFLHCHYFTDIRSTLLDDLKSMDVNILGFPDSEINFYACPKFDLNQNTKILSSSFSFILKFEIFHGSFL